MNFAYNQLAKFLKFIIIDQALFGFSNTTSQTKQSRSTRLAQNETMELMLYIDRQVINARGGNTAATNYVLSIMNIVSYVHNLALSSTLKCSVHIQYTGLH